jgi:hypothetical protein
MRPKYDYLWLALKDDNGRNQDMYHCGCYVGVATGVTKTVTIADCWLRFEPKASLARNTTTLL